MPFIPDDENIKEYSSFVPDEPMEEEAPVGASGNELVDMIQSQTDEEKKKAALGAIIDSSSSIVDKLSNFATNLKSKIGGRVDTFKEDIEKTAEGKINPAEAGIRTFGGLAGGLGDVLVEGLKVVMPDRTKELIKSGISKTAEQPLVQDVYSKLDEWSKKNPEAARDLGAMLDIAAIIPAGKGASLLEKGAAGAMKVEKLADIAGKKTAKLIGTDALTRATKALTLTDAELGAKELTENILKYHGDPGGFLKRMSVDTSGEAAKLATRLQDKIISKNPIRNINNLQREFIKEDLRVGRNLFTEKIPIDKNKLGDYLFNKVKDIADLQANPEVLSKFKEQVVADFVKKVKAPELGPVWRARKVFDRVADAKYKVFSGADTTKKDILREIRNGAQEFIAKTAKQSGSRFDYTGAMKRMSDMYDAAAIFAQKAAKKVGTSESERLMSAFMDKVNSIVPAKTIIKKLILK